MSLLRCPEVGPHPPKWRATLPSLAGWPEHVLRLDAVVIIRGGGSGGEPGGRRFAPGTGRRPAAWPRCASVASSDLQSFDPRFDAFFAGLAVACSGAFRA